MGTFPLYVRFPDGEVWHGVYDSVTDTAARFLSPTADDVAGWCMESDYREDGDLDGQGDPVDIATDYGDFWWRGTALRLSGPGEWCWLTGPVGCDDETTTWERPAWLEYKDSMSGMTDAPTCGGRTELTIHPRQGGKRAATEAKIAEVLAAGWTEVTDDPAYGPPTPGVRKFNRPPQPAETQGAERSAP